MTADYPKLINLQHLSLLHMQGPDARQFLQGQVTCDVRGLDSHHWLHGAHCTPKGRMVANFDLFAGTADDLYLRLPASTAAILLGALKKYLVFSKSNLEDISEQMRCVGIMADNLDALMQELQLTELRSCRQIDSQSWLRLDEQRLECWLPADAELPPMLADLPQCDNSAAWQARDIRIGRGWVSAETTGEFIPQLLNLNNPAIAGISFTKGCYTGQEIVARTHYKGKLKRHMYRYVCPTEIALSPNASLYADNGEQVIGHVVNSVCIDGSTEVLAIVTEEVAETAVCSGPGQGEKFERQSLPYAITN